MHTTGLAIAGFVALVGLVLVWWGLRPRRSGSELFCRRCEYNLTGTDLTTTEARCPECGSVLTARRAIVIGRRHIRWRRVGIGLLVLLLGSAPLVVLGLGALYNVDYYHYAPLGYVLYEAESGDPQAAARAFGELNRRLNLGPLESNAIVRAAEAALGEQGRPRLNRAAAQSAMRLLANLQLGGQLPAELEERFFEQMVTLKTQTRDRAPAGAEFFLGVKQHVRGPEATYWLESSLKNVRIDGGAPLPLYHGFIYRSTLGETGTQQYPLTIANPGTHVIMAEATITFREAAGGAAALDSPVLHTLKRKLEVEVEVVPYELAGPEPAASAVLDEWVRANVRLNAPELKVRDDGEVWLVGLLFFKGVRPVGFALTGEAVFEGGRAPLEVMLMEAGGAAHGSHGVSVQGSFSGPLPEQVTVTLRTCRECALKHPEMDRVWSGVMQFPEVEVIEPANKSANVLMKRYAPEVLRLGVETRPSN